MPIGPMDDYLAHQTTDTFDHVFTSDRNFFDRYYFNLHASSDELFMVTGIGQYPNLGVDRRVRLHLATATTQYTVRASRGSSGSDRLNTRVGPFRRSRSSRACRRLQPHPATRTSGGSAFDIDVRTACIAPARRSRARPFKKSLRPHRSSTATRYAQLRLVQRARSQVGGRDVRR